MKEESKEIKQWIEFVAQELEKQRFVGLDQNPKGIRDILWSQKYRLEDIIKDLK